MSALSPRGGGALKCFRLGEVPIEIRERAKSVALRREDSFVERVKIGMAAERPSDRVYVVSRAAWERVMGR